MIKRYQFSGSKGDVVSVIGARRFRKSTNTPLCESVRGASGGSAYHGSDMQIKMINVQHTSPFYKVGMVFQVFNLFNNAADHKELHGRSDQGSWKKKEEAEEKQT